MFPLSTSLAASLWAVLMPKPYLLGKTLLIVFSLFSGAKDKNGKLPTTFFVISVNFDEAFFEVEPPRPIVCFNLTAQGQDVPLTKLGSRTVERRGNLLGHNLCTTKDLPRLGMEVIHLEMSDYFDLTNTNRVDLKAHVSVWRDGFGSRKIEFR